MGSADVDDAWAYMAQQLDVADSLNAVAPMNIIQQSQERSDQVVAWSKQTRIPTGFPELDYKLGYKVNVCDADGNYVSSYPSLGITAGSYVLFIGKPSTSKTATAVKIASNIVRPFDNGTVIHYDLKL